MDIVRKSYGEVINYNIFDIDSLLSNNIANHLEKMIYRLLRTI
jgi:hypothetical protein